MEIYSAPCLSEHSRRNENELVVVVIVYLFISQQISKITVNFEDCY